MRVVCSFSDIWDDCWKFVSSRDMSTCDVLSLTGWSGSVCWRHWLEAVWLCWHLPDRSQSPRPGRGGQCHHMSDGPPSHTHRPPSTLHTHTGGPPTRRTVGLLVWVRQNIKINRNCFFVNPIRKKIKQVLRKWRKFDTKTCKDIGLPFPSKPSVGHPKDKGSQSVKDSLVKWEAWWTLRQEERVFILEGEKNWGSGWAKLNVPHFRWDNPALFLTVVSTANKSGMYRRRDIRLWSNILLSIGLTCSPGYNCKFKERETVDSLEDCTRFEIKPQTQSGLGLL